MKIMKFGGTSVGSPDRMKALIQLINDDERKIVILSAMAGTTNSLVEITDLLYADNINEASVKNINLKSKYHQVVEELFATENFKKSGHEMIDSHFEYTRDFTLRKFTKLQEKAILARGELISTSLFHLLLQEMNIKSVLLPALSFMRIDKDGEPDSFYIKENIGRELKKHTSEKLIITQGFICRNAFGEIDNLKRGGSDFTASLIGAALNASEIQIWTDINGFHNNDPRFVENTNVIRELSFDEAAELAYFGLVESAFGSGAGRWLMNEAIGRAWARPIRRLFVHTCTFDHAGAIAFYVRSGFRPYKYGIEVIDDPRLTGVLSREAAPHIPLIG